MRTHFFIAAVFFLLHGEILAQDGSPFLREGPIGKSESDLVCDVGKRDPYPVACWEGEQVVFLPSYRGHAPRYEDPDFIRRAGSIADIVSAEEVRDGTYRIVLRDRADGRELSRNVGSDDSTLIGTALVRDIEAARELYLGDTLHIRRTSLNTYDPSVHRLRSFEVEFDARVSIQDIVVGWDTDRPLRVVVRTEDGEEGFVDVAWRQKNNRGEAVGPGVFENSFAKDEMVHVSYCMQLGDDLLTIAEMYGVSPEELKRWNNLNRDYVWEGQVLRIYAPDNKLYELIITCFTPDVFVIVEDMPELIGGLAAVQNNIRYPEIARKAGVEGRVFVTFVVDEQGNVVNPRVKRGLGAGLDEEAIRLISQAKFTPGTQRGHPVPVRMELPITFRIPR